MTVVLSANTSWYLYNHRASTLRALRELGYKVICLAPEDSYSQLLISDMGCDWRPLNIDNHGTNPLVDMAVLYQYWRYYRKLAPSVVCHFTIKNNVYGTWAAALLGIPAINNISGMGTAFENGGLLSALARLLYRTSQGFAHTVYCQNEFDMQRIKDRQLIPESLLRLLPGSGVDLDRFPPATLEQEGNRKFRFLYAGRMLGDKGMPELVEAMKLLIGKGYQCELWLVGFAGVQNKTALSETEMAELDNIPGIEWKGPTDQMEDIYRQVDCVVLPSYHEGLPRLILEACASSIPVIASDIPGCRAVIEEGYNGLLCKVRDSQSLAGAMATMLAMPQQERTLLGKNGRKLMVQKYDERLVVDETLRTIHSAGNISNCSLQS
jgi:glycosyltransferase involved in cell wall biosynthesis